MIEEILRLFPDAYTRGQVWASFTPGEPLHVAVEHKAGCLPFYVEHGVRGLPVRIGDHNVDREHKGIPMCREEAGLQAAPSHERLELYVHHVPVGGYGRKVQWGLEAVFEDHFHYLREKDCGEKPTGSLMVVMPIS